MASRRITLSVPERTAMRLERVAGDMPVSAWVTELIEQRLEDLELERGWREFYREVAPTAQDARRADRLFERLAKPARRRTGSGAPR